MEEIIARLGLDASTFQRGITLVDQQIQGFKQTVTDIGTRIAAAFTAGALLNMAKEAVQYASDITDAAEATRTGVVEYQVLAQAARESGASMQQLDQALIKSTLSGEKAAEGNKELKAAFALLNIDVAAFNQLPTERKLEEIGAAYVATGRAQEAYAAITEILGTKSAPRLISALESLGRDGFDAMRAKAEEAGVVLNALDAQKLDRLSDTIQSWKTGALVVLGEVISSFERMFQWLGGKTREQIYFEEANPAAAAARVDAINQLIEEDFAAHQARMAELGSRRNPYYDEAAAKQKIINAVQEDEQRIQERTIQLVQDRATKEAEVQAEKEAQFAAAARAAELEQSNAETARVLRMVEEGRALLKLKEMSDKERLVQLEAMHAVAVSELNNMELLGEGTAKEKEAIGKRVLDLEKEIGSTKEKIANDEKKSNEERAKAQEDLLELIKEQARLQGVIDQRMFDQYGRDVGDLAAAGGSSTLTAWAQAAERAAADAQRNFDQAARLQAAAANAQGADRDSLLRDALAAEERAKAADQRRTNLERDITAAQGGDTGDPLVDKMEETRKEIEKLREQLEAK